MSFVQANGLTFHVQELGRGRPVALVHGMIVGNLASWYFSVAPVLAQDRRVLMYDLRGHGKSERARSGYDLAMQAADLLALTEAWDAAALDVVGHSYGGLVALRFALDHPERIRRLVVVDAPLPPQQIEERRLVSAMDADDMLRLADPVVLRAAIAGAGHDPEALMDRLLPPGMRQGVLSSKRRLRSLLGGLQFLATETTLGADVGSERDFAASELGRLNRPVLCVYGERSGCRAAGERLVRELPQARLCLLPGGHYLLAERPLELAAAVREFLDGA